MTGFEPGSSDVRNNRSARDKRVFLLPRRELELRCTAKQCVKVEVPFLSYQFCKSAKFSD